MGVGLETFLSRLTAVGSVATRGHEDVASVKWTVL